MHDGFVIACRGTDVETEKQHDELMHNITEFRSERLKRTSTSEKIVLPTPEGMIFSVGCLASHSSSDYCPAPANELYRI